MSKFNRTYTLPFKYKIPELTLDFLKKNSFILRWLKFKKRQIYIKLKGQEQLEANSILPSQKRILWINISAPSLGDSLMDLSSRVLLLGRKVDLFTDKKNETLYKDDTIFRSVFSKEDNINASNYDLIIIDSYSSRSIKVKANIAPLLPYIGMYGYYNGPEVNRVLFSFHRLNHLLGCIKSEIEINSNARTLLSIAKADQLIVKQKKIPQNYIAIAIGGEWQYRSYNKWKEVIELLFMQEEALNIVIIGSDNGTKLAQDLMESFKSYNLYNCVAQFSFNQTAQIIYKAQLLLCCDGGLMHAGNAVNTGIVPLLSKLSSKMQLTDSIHDFSIFDKENVNNIDAISIVKKYFEASSFYDSHPQGE